MGTDIHGVFQKYDAQLKTWIDVPSLYEQNRHYQLFAVLADVRKGTGLAGCVTGDPVIPISEPRGLPDDFNVQDSSHPISDIGIMDPRRQKYHESNEPLEIYMGDHSYSWLTGDELLEWYGKDQAVIQKGVLSRDEYSAWDHVNIPESYCGGISGLRIVVIDDGPDILSNKLWTHAQCQWTSNLNKELAYFFDEVKRLVDEHGQIRFVFGFDN